MNFNIHDLFKFKIEGTNKKHLKHFCQNYSHFKTDEEIKSELDIKVSNFTPDNNNCHIVDQKYYIKKKYLFCNDSNKIVKWKVCIRDIENKPTVYFSGGLFSEIFLMDDIIEPLIGFKLAQKGYSLVHASSIVIDDNGFIFIGGPGSGKTSIILNSIRNSNAFLSDEISILSNNNMIYSFPLPIRIYNHNLINNSHVYERLTLPEIFKIKIKYLIYLLSVKYIKLPQHVKAEKLFDKIGKKSFMYSLVLLSKTTKNKIKLIVDIDKEEFVKRLMWINKYQFRRFSEYLSAYSSCYPKSKTASYWQILEKNLSESVKKSCCYEIETPSKYDYSSFEEFDIVLNEMRDIIDDKIWKGSRKR